MHRLHGALRGGVVALALFGWLVPAAAFAAGDAAKGKALFEGMGTCWTCHGKEGKGDGPASAPLNPKPRDLSGGEFKFDADKDGKAGTDTDLAMVIKNGPAAYGGSNAMPYFKHLSDEQIADIVAFIRSLGQ